MKNKDKMDSYRTYRALDQEFSQSLGYSGKQELPDTFVLKLAEFIDAHPADTLTAYYAQSLLDKFYRKRTKQRSVNLFNSLNSHLNKKSFLIALFLECRSSEQHPIYADSYDIAAIWLAIHDLVDGYAKANYIGKYSRLFTDEMARFSYQAILAMPDIYKIRALGGIYPRMDKLHKAEILPYLYRQFLSGSPEAAYQLKGMFPHLDEESKTEVISLHLDMPGLPEEFLAYLVIRNAQYLQPSDANRIAARVRMFPTDYFRNRCLLKLAAYLPAGEIEALFKRFMEDFNTLEPSSELIHNLYHFGAVLKTLEKSDVINMALEKIACLDDSESELYNQQKYSEMSFIVPLLTEANKARAIGIAETVKGGYKRNLIARLQVHFSHSKGFCGFRGALICY
ncbi:hypothetical protein LXA47_21130 [Massilia sp. P8910]|uniref:hypothetical protein n=1 Tax=Massilia antarctica TaxID=2765360 RepID=UPI001E60D69A|nr:hypothetical protein [Massilia antarctica]MCE3606090.1 hypothetical protein [Massilia antarctica]